MYPYRLRNLVINRPNRDWNTATTYVPMSQSFKYLVAVTDWCRRYVVAWRLSNTLAVDFCLDPLNQTLCTAKPDTFNFDQFALFASPRLTGRFEGEGILISMGGPGRALDNVFVECPSQSHRYEDPYVKSYEIVSQLYQGLSDHFVQYNQERPH